MPSCCGLPRRSDVFYLFYPRQLHPLRKLLQQHAELDNFHQVVFPFAVHLLVQERYSSDTDFPRFFPQNCNPLYVLWRERRWGFVDAAQAQHEARRQGVRANASWEAHAAAECRSATDLPTYA